MDSNNMLGSSLNMLGNLIGPRKIQMNGQTLVINSERNDTELNGRLGAHLDMTLGVLSRSVEQGFLIPDEIGTGMGKIARVFAHSDGDPRVSRQEHAHALLAFDRNKDGDITPQEVATTIKIANASRSDAEMLTTFHSYPNSHSHPKMI
jgi:hypothetical protein